MLLVACLAPSKAQAARKPEPSTVSRGPCPSPRQARLETFRRTQEQVRDQKRASRKARLDSKQARLVEAVERARDRIQVLCLALMHPAPARPARNAGRDARSVILGSTFLYLLAGELLAAGEAADAAAAVPPPPTDGQQGGQGGAAGPAAAAVPGDGVSGELPLELTNILMEQLALDEAAQASPMARRALAAQRSMMQNALAAAVATGTLSAAGNQLFLIAYASDAVAGAVAIHKFREPYLDALLRVADAEEGWIQAYGAYQEVRGRPAVPGLPAGGTGQGGPGPSSSAATTSSAETGMEVPARPSIGTGGAGPATASAASPGADSRGQASGAARSARPFWRDF